MLISLPKSSFRALLFAVGIVLAALTAAAEVSASETIAWRLLQPGLEYATVVLPPVPGSSDTQLHVVRVNPRIAHLRGLMASEHGNTPRTAGQWCTEFGLSAAINLGMFKMDGITNVGYARNGAHRNNPGWNSYQAVLALLPSKNGLAAVRWIDRDHAGDEFASLTDYGLVVQNLRLIKRPGVNVWSKQPNRWSEAAIALDSQGRLLFLFSRAPRTAWEFNQMILTMPLGIVAAMHVEGGPAACLSVHTPAVRVDAAGSYETGHREDDKNIDQCPIPNVLGVVAAQHR